KDELREAIEYARDNSTNFDSFKRHLNDVYGVETKLRGKTLSFKHPERERFIRANKLGADYEREGLEHVFARQIEREQEHERRSEEHTSELQSRFDLVCRLLLEKKNKIKKLDQTTKKIDEVEFPALGNA